jgi:hypothetical protein
VLARVQPVDFSDVVRFPPARGSFTPDYRSVSASVGYCPLIGIVGVGLDEIVVCLGACRSNSYERRESKYIYSLTRLRPLDSHYLESAYDSVARKLSS